MEKTVTKVFFLLGLFLFSGQGAMADLKRIDGHIHVVSPKQWKESKGFDGPISMKEVVDAINGAELDKAIILSAGFLFTKESQARFENDYVAKLVDSSPNQIIGACSVVVNQKWAIREVLRCQDELKLNILKLHLQRNKISLLKKSDREGFEVFLKQLESKKWSGPIIVHVDWIDPLEAQEFYRIVWKHSKIDFILAHSLGSNYRSLGFLANFYDVNPETPRNLYLDLSVSIPFFAESPDRDFIVWMMRKIGLKYFLFGSDFPVKTPLETKGRLKSLGLNSEEENSLYTNINQLLKN